MPVTHVPRQEFESFGVGCRTSVAIDAQNDVSFASRSRVSDVFEASPLSGLRDDCPSTRGELGRRLDGQDVEKAWQIGIQQISYTHHTFRFLFTHVLSSTVPKGPSLSQIAVTLQYK
jgi:hypothetical protein